MLSINKHRALILTCTDSPQVVFNYAPGFDLTTPDSDFTILVEVFTNHILVKHIFHESCRMNKS